MGIVIKGSGGSIKFSGTGGGINARFIPPPPASPPMALMSAWYDAEDIAQADGSSVESWSDKSGNGNNLSYFGTAPTLDTSGTNFNGKKVVNFSHSNNVIALRLYGLNNFPTGNDPISLYTVFKSNYMGPYAFHPVISIGQTYNRLNLMGALEVNGAGGYVSGSPNWWTFLDLPGHPSDYYSASTNTRIASFIIDSSQGMGDAEFLINGTTTERLTDVTGGGAPNLPANAYTEIVLGGLAGETSYMGYPQQIAYAYEGKIAEVIIYKTKHSTSDRDQTLSYLAAKYGVSI